MGLSSFSSTIDAAHSFMNSKKMYINKVVNAEQPMIVYTQVLIRSKQITTGLKYSAIGSAIQEFYDYVLSSRLSNTYADQLLQKIRLNCTFVLCMFPNCVVYMLSFRICHKDEEKVFID